MMVIAINFFSDKVNKVGSQVIELSYLGFRTECEVFWKKQKMSCKIRENTTHKIMKWSDKFQEKI